jgi:hypothetical protein
MDSMFASCSQCSSFLPNVQELGQICMIGFVISARLFVGKAAQDLQAVFH